jgi:hypothetical protein
MNGGEELDSLLDESSKFLKKPTVLNSFPKPATLTSFNPSKGSSAPPPGRGFPSSSFSSLSSFFSFLTGVGGGGGPLTLLCSSLDVDGTGKGLSCNGEESFLLGDFGRGGGGSGGGGGRSST